MSKFQFVPQLVIKTLRVVYPLLTIFLSGWAVQGSAESLAANGQALNPFWAGALGALCVTFLDLLYRGLARDTFESSTEQVAPDHAHS